MEGFTNDFADVEASYGFVGSDTMPVQWAKLSIEDAAAEKSKDKGTLGIAIRLRCDETLAKTPKRGFYARLWLTGKLEGKIVGFTKAVGLGRTLKRFGAPTGPRDTRPQFTTEEAEVMAKQIAAAIKGRVFVGKVGIEADGVHPDKNVLDAHFPATEQNLAAIAAAKFEVTGIKEVEKKNGDVVVDRVLEVKTGGAASGGSAKPAAGAPNVIE
jgi:hypothetical protein